MTTPHPDPNAGTETSTPYQPIQLPGEPSSPATDPNVNAPASSDPQPGPVDPGEVTRPRLAHLFAEQLARLNLTADGAAHHGALPDLELDPAEVDPALADELKGMRISVPAVERWGVFGGLRPTGEGSFSVKLDDESLEIPELARLHLSSRAWREAGEGRVAPLTDQLPASPLHGAERAPDGPTGPRNA